MVDQDDRRRGAVDPQRNWIPYAIGAVILLLVLIFAMRGCSARDATETNTAAVSSDGAYADGQGAAGTGVGVGAGNGAMTAGADGSTFTVEGLRGYLQGTDAAPANGRAFGLDRVTFDTGSADLDQQDLAEITDVVGVLKQFPNASVIVTGYTDPEGDAAANKKLAARRTVAVKNALAKDGIPAARLTTNVVGETGTAAVPANRRVELLVKR